MRYNSIYSVGELSSMSDVDAIRALHPELEVANDKGNHLRIPNSDFELRDKIRAEIIKMEDDHWGILEATFMRSEMDIIRDAISFYCGEGQISEETQNKLFECFPNLE